METEDKVEEGNDNKHKTEVNGKIVPQRQNSDLDDGQVNIARDPTPVDKVKEFSFDSKENNPIRVVNSNTKEEPKSNKKEEKKPQIKNPVKKEEKKSEDYDDPFSAFDFLSSGPKENKNTENAFGIDFTPSEPQENSGIWKIEDSQENIFKNSSKLDESKEINELDNLINESLNSSKMEMKMLDEEVQERAPDEDDPFNTFKNVFL